MSLIVHAMYSFYLYFLLPVLVLVLIGQPRFLIKLIHMILNLKEPIKEIKIFMFIWISCGLYAGLNLFQKFTLEKVVQALDKSQKNIEIYDNKMRELNLAERNAYMYLNFFIIIMIIERLCDSYFKLWVEEDKKTLIEKKILEISNKKDN